jgi:hypothetical protein
MPTIDDCKRNAEQCLRWADEAANNEQRDTLLEIAALWTHGPRGHNPSLKLLDFSNLPPDGFFVWPLLPVSSACDGL